MIGKPLATFSGKTFRAIEIAAAELAGRGMNVSDYTIVVDELDAQIAIEVTGVRCNSIVVSFQHPEQQAGLLGSDPRLSGFTVALDAITLNVTTAHFVK